MAVTRVLVGFGDALSAPEVVRSLRGRGLEIGLIVREGTRPPVSRTAGVTAHEVPSPFSDAAGCAAAIGRLAADYDGVLPLDDAMLVLLHDAGRSTPPLAQHRVVANKHLQFDHAKPAGFFGPPYTLISKGNVLDDAAAPGSMEGAQRSPGIVKPSDMESTSGNRFGRAAGSDFERHGDARREAIERSGDGSTWIVQEFVTGTGSGLFGIASDGRIHCPSAHERVRMMNPAGSDSRACRSVPVDPETLDRATRIVTEVGRAGMFMIETLRDRNGRTAFIEFNGRPWGSLALARHAGLDFPAWRASLCLGHGLPPETCGRTGVVARDLGREIIHTLFVLRGNTSGAPSWPKRSSLLRMWSRDLVGARWFNAFPGERCVPVRDAVGTVLSKFSKNR